LILNQKQTKLLLVTNNKLFLFLFFSGLVCIFVAGLSLFISINPQIFKDKIQYEVGKVLRSKGRVQILKDDSRVRVDSGRKVYSKEEFFVAKNSFVSLSLANENIKILGPAQFELQVVSPEKAQVFINFSKYTDVDPKLSFEQIHLTFNGWLIEPYFKESDLNTSKTQDISMPAIQGGSSNGTDTSEMKESMLDELIGAKRDLLKRCYENYLRNNPMATGKLVAEFTLQNSGRVSSSRIKDSSFFKDETFKNCVQDVFTRIKTSAFSGDAILVTYPIEFE